MDQIMPFLTHTGTAGVVCFMLLKWTIPSMLKAFKEEMEAERAAHAKSTRRILRRLLRIEKVMCQEMGKRTDVGKKN